MTTAKRADPAAAEKAPIKRMMPSAPETGSAHPKKRKRLAKAFKRPLDKKLRSTQVLREKYSLLADEYEQLLALKKRLSDQGLPVKKGDLLRAGLALLVALDDDDLKGVVATIVSIAEAAETTD